MGEFTNANFLEFDKTKKYDCVCSFGFIEHFDGWEDVLRKHALLVWEGGVIAVTTLNFRGAIQQWLHRLLDVENLRRHNIASMNPFLWADLLKELGFDVIDARSFGRFDFWVEKQKRNVLQNAARFVIRVLTPVLKLLPGDNGLYSPYCGVVARRPPRKPVS